MAEFKALRKLSPCMEMITTKTCLLIYLKSLYSGNFSVYYIAKKCKHEIKSYIHTYYIYIIYQKLYFHSINSNPRKLSFLKQMSSHSLSPKHRNGCVNLSSKSNKKHSAFWYFCQLIILVASLSRIYFNTFGITRNFHEENICLKFRSGPLLQLLILRLSNEPQSNLCLQTSQLWSIKVEA